MFGVHYYGATCAVIALSIVVGSTTKAAQIRFPLAKAACGPSAGDADAIISKHEMRLGHERAAWKVGAYVKSPRTTKSEIWQADDRPVYSNPFMLLEGNATLPWFKMAKSDVLVFWHKGDPMLIHSIGKDGQYQVQLMGDELLIPNANFSARFDPGTWLAYEVYGDHEERYSFYSNVLVPGFKKEYLERGSEEDLIRLLGTNQLDLIKRLVLPEGVPDYHSP